MDSVDGEFGLRHLSGELLEGVLQRLGGQAKREAELIDQGFAAIARRRAWRHWHRLFVYYPYSESGQGSSHMLDLRVGPFEVVPGVPEHAASVVRFLTNRSVIQHVEFIGDAIRMFIAMRRSDFDDIIRLVGEQGRAIVAALMASERVQLQSLLLRPMVTVLFGGTDDLVTLIGRNSATLRQVALGLCDVHHESAIYVALHGCPNLQKLTAFQYVNWHDALTELVGGLRLSSLTLRGDTRSRLNLCAILPKTTTLRELRLDDVHVGLDDDGADWSALQNVRLLASNQQEDYSGIGAAAANLPLGDVEKMKLILFRVLPHIETLIIRQSTTASSFWGEVQVLSKAFLNRPGVHSLAVQLCMSIEDCFEDDEMLRQLGAWQAAFPDLLVERFNAAADAAADAAKQGVVARPSLPVEFDRAANSAAFVLRRPNESRWLLIAVSWHC